MKPHLKKTWCIGQITSSFIARMERILWLYSLPYDLLYDPLFPVVCFDERPCFLIGEAVAPLNPQPGQIAREHYAYTKNGSCCLLAVIEPLTGVRLAQLHPHLPNCIPSALNGNMRSSCGPYPNDTHKPTKSVWCKITSTPMNTHDMSALYETFLPKRPSPSRSTLSQHFEFHFTPKSASWLNMIEIEFSALARQCLHRRIPTLGQMERELSTLVQEREDKAIQIKWQFSIPKARQTFHNQYQNIRINITELK